MNRAPFEAWRGTRPSVSHLRVFGCIAYALVNSQFRHKLDEKSEKCIFIGYCTQSKAYRLYNPLSGKILIRRDVVFDENASWDWRGSDEKRPQQVPMSIGISPNECQEPTPTSSPASSSTASPSSSASALLSRDSSSTLEESSDETPSRKFRSLRDINESCQFALTVSAAKQEWQRAMMEELTAIEKNGTWEMV